jgi:pyruvate formate lyase activating enzyme
MHMSKAQDFLEYLQKINKRTWLRYVLIPNLNDNEESIGFLAALAKSHPCVDKVEQLPFKKICKVKYENVVIPFAFDRYNAADPGAVSALQEKLNQML